MKFPYGVECKLKENFSVVRETLERIGIANHKKKEIYPSCYLLHKRDTYYILHFKNLLKLDGKQVENFDENDQDRELNIALLLEKWGLIEIVDKEKVAKVKQSFVFVLPHSKRDEYKVIHKYQIGIRKTK